MTIVGHISRGTDGGYKIRGTACSFAIIDDVFEEVTVITVSSTIKKNKEKRPKKVWEKKEY